MVFAFLSGSPYSHFNHQKVHISLAEYQQDQKIQYKQRFMKLSDAQGGRDTVSDWKPRR